MRNSRALLLVFLLLTPVFWVGAQDIVFKDSFEPFPPGYVYPDRDQDGLPDIREVTIGTDPDDPDTDGDGFGDGSEVAVGTDPLDADDFPAVPDDPRNTAPEPDAGVASNARDSNAFLYTGDDPIQHGVSPGTIDIERAGLLRGRVVTRLGAPLPGVTISVLNRPEFGTTLTRADGRFDLAINGGSSLTIDYVLDGFLPSQRTVDADWQEYVSVPEVAMIPLDPIVNPIDLSAPGAMKVARGSVQGDTDGIRQATILFPAGVNAELRMGDDTTVPIENLSVRATEYTVGGRGQESMPGDLPPTSGYTYAVELSVDEAIAMGATSVEFDQPLPFYVENFLGFPAGTPVPTGYYDRERGAWVPAPDGRVIDIVRETGGLAELDVDGDGMPDTGSSLDALGITDAERRQIATLYRAGDSLWRVPIDHFTAWDHNWPIGPPNDAEFPNQAEPYSDYSEIGMCEVGGSIIECQNQVLRKRVPVTGTPFTLNYSSHRTSGRLAARHLEIPLTDEENPQSLIRVDMRVGVAGQVFDFSYDATPGLVQPLTWDGMDAFGRKVQGTATANVRIGYVYEGVYRTGGSGDASFGQPGQLPIIAEGNRTRANFILPQEYQTTVGNWDAGALGLGGWSLSIHHAYDPANQVLYRGDGHRRSAGQVPEILDMAAGILDNRGYAIRCDPNEDPTCGDGFPATEVPMSSGTSHIAFGPDGSMYISDRALEKIRRIRPDGIIETIAGTGESYVSNQDGSISDNGDGGPALEAKLADPGGIAIDAMGNIYFAETRSQVARIRKIDTTGIITTYAGTGTIWPPNGSALEVDIDQPWDLEIDRQGNLYLVNICFVVRIDTGGRSSVIAGDPDRCGDFFGDGGPAIDAGLSAEGLDVGPDGTIYIADSGNYRIRKIGKDGIITTIAGTGNPGFSGDGGSAISAEIDYVFDLAVDREGGVYVPDPFEEARLRYIDPDGLIRTVGGLGFSFDVSGMFGPPTNAWLYPFYVEIGPDNNIYIPLQGNDSSIRVIKSPLSGLSAGDILVPSEDGSELYLFDSAGRHQQTRHALTGATLYAFSYGADGLLETVTDGDGKVTTIERDGFGNPTGIVGPYGQRTALEVDPNGHLRKIENPAAEEFQIQSTADGLITRTTDARGKISDYQYDAMGRLTSLSDNAGYEMSLVRSGSGGDVHVVRSSTLGRDVEYRQQQSAARTQSNVNTAPDGSQSNIAYQVAEGKTTATSATGMTSTITEGPDTRFAMQSPLATEAVISAPGGPTMTITSSSVSDLTDPDDPLSLESLRGGVTINGRRHRMEYTAATRTMVHTSAGNRETIVEIDALGRVVSSQLGDQAPVITSYNALGQIESITHGTGADARVTSFNYGSDGFWDSITDPLGRTVAFEHDAAGRMTRKTLPGNVDILFGYGSDGALNSITPPTRPAHRFDYDLHGQLIRVTPPTVTGGGATTHSYNEDLQILSKTLPGAEAVRYSYDEQGRLAGVELRENGSPTSSYTMNYGVANRLAAVVGPGSQELAYGYQGDLPVSETWSGLVEGSVEWSWDDSFRLASQTVTGGTTVEFSYDPDDLLINVGALSINRFITDGLARFGTLGAVRDGWTYNAFGEVIAYSASANGSPVFEASFTYDDGGRIVRKVETVGGVTDTFDYDYNLRGELVEVQKNSVVVESYSYDDNGNRVSVTLGGVTAAASHDDQDRMLSFGDTTFGYSPAGRLETRTLPANQVTDFDYDPLGNLRSVTLPDATVVSYSIDGSDRRVQRMIDGTVVQQFIYDGQLPLAELDADGNVVSQFVYADGNVPVYMIRGGVNYRIITDQVGSVRLVINASDGSIEQRLDYDSFGNVLLDTNPGFQPFGFAGGVYDPVTELVHFVTRDYDPQTGRWTASDLIGFTGEDTNLYRYANNDPINYSDPAGTGFWSKALGLVGGIGDGMNKLMNPAMAIQSAVNGLSTMIEDWLDINNDWRNPDAGNLYPPPPGVDESEYRDYHFYGECGVDVASIALTGGPGALRGLARLGPAIGRGLSRSGDKLRVLPEVFKGLGNGLGRGLGRVWDEARILGRKAWNEVALDANALPDGKVRHINRIHPESTTRANPGRGR